MPECWTIPGQLAGWVPSDRCPTHRGSEALEGVGPVWASAPRKGWPCGPWSILVLPACTRGLHACLGRHDKPVWESRSQSAADSALPQG